MVSTLGHVRGSHLVGGEIYYEQLSATNYLVTLKIYRDCNSVNQNGTLTPFDNPALLAVYEGTNLISLENMNHSTPSRIPVVVDNPCLDAPPNICVDEAVYEKQIVLPISHNGITLTYQRCCRNQSIQNITGPPPLFSGSIGSTYSVDIPPTANMQPNETNSTPKFKNFPPLVICMNDPLQFNHSAIDSDGDSLYYEFCDPMIGLTPGNPTPNTTNNIPKAPPYTPVPWSAGFSATNPITALPQLSIDPSSGRITGTPNTQGQFVVGVCVSEYRRGQLLSSVRRDFQFNVTFCNAKPVAAASSQESYCDGLTVNFKNKSNNAKYFNWDFGDPSTQNDTSTQKEPSYTYPDTGKYEITLIVNKGWPCADTTSTIYAVYDKLLPFYDPGTGQCFENNSFNFKAGGLFQEYATFEWNFGNSASPNRSFQRNPIDIRFQKPGEYPVELTIKENGCVGLYEDTVKVYPNPIAEFELEDASGCMPFAAKFNNLSQSWTDLTYLWEFGDDSTSTLLNPEHLYLDSGWYDVKLTIFSSGVCADTSIFAWKDLVKVHHLPEAGMRIENKLINSLNPVAVFHDLSLKNDWCKLYLGDGSSTAECDFQYTYGDTGVFNITQIVSTKNGCRDTVTDQLRIVPQPLFYAPNAFTPNGDNINDYYMPVVYGVVNYEFIVLSRWGEILFETDHHLQGWNGQAPSGKDSPISTYVYLVKYTDVFGNEYNHRGIFSLLR